MDKKITRNAIRCKKCGDVVESADAHDCKFCSCQSVGVDGGREYLRRLGNIGDFEEMAEFEEESDFVANDEIAKYRKYMTR